MDKRYFTVVRSKISDVDFSLLSGRCIKVLHGFLASKYNDINHSIGVTFPKWTNDSLGNEIAFISTSSSVLEQLMNQRYFEIMVSNKIFSISSICTVPKEIPEVQFIRNQNIAKCFGGEKRRRLARGMRRAAERGETFEPESAFNERDVEFFHRISMTSKQSGQSYLLHIQKQDAKSINHTFNAYGFATRQKYKVSVPDLSCLDPFFITDF